MISRRGIDPGEFLKAFVVRAILCQTSALMNLSDLPSCVLITLSSSTTLHGTYLRFHHRVASLYY
jgi:hypothetical protein